jgi:hypothetical protein
MRDCIQCGSQCKRKYCRACYQQHAKAATYCSVSACGNKTRRNERICKSCKAQCQTKRCVVEDCGAAITNYRHSFCADCYRQAKILPVCVVQQCTATVSHRKHKFCTSCYRSFHHILLKCSQTGCKKVAEHGSLFCYKCYKYRLATQIPCSTPGCPRSCLANNNYQCGVCHHMEKQTLLLIAREQEATLRHYREFYTPLHLPESVDQHQEDIAGRCEVLLHPMYAFQMQ